MFTYTIATKDFFNGQLKITGKFSNGVQSFTEEFTITSKSQLDHQIKNRIKQLEEMEVLETQLMSGDYTPAPDVIIPQTQAEIDQQKWFRDFNRFEQLTKLNTLGALRPALVTDLDTLRATVTTDFKKAYIADM